MFFGDYAFNFAVIVCLLVLTVCIFVAGDVYFGLCLSLFTCYLLLV